MLEFTFTANQNLNILIVEDDESIRETLKLLLEVEGYFVTVASNGREALELLKKIDTPFMILLDLMMPVMDGNLSVF